MDLQQKAFSLELGLAKVQSALSKRQIDALEHQFEDVYMDLQPSPEDYQARKIAVDFVNGLARDKLSVGDVSKHHGFCNARAFGSFTMDMFTSTSDLDISLNVEYGSETLTRQDGVNLLKKLTKLLYKLQSNGTVRNIQPVLKAKVPVVKFIHCKTGIECDVSVENRDGIVKSELLRVFSSIDSRFRKLCFLLKAWANANGINSSKDNTLNSLSLILLAALHLQTRVPAIIPPFSMLLKGEDSSRASQLASLVERQAKAYKNFGKHNNESVVQLFNSFLTKIMAVKDLWQEGLCASVYEGTWTFTNSPSWIFVEDFTSLSQNAARAVNGAGFEAIYECFNQASIHLRDYFSGLHEAKYLKTLLFDLHINSAVHKRKRNKKNDTIANSDGLAQDSSDDPLSRFRFRRPEPVPVYTSAQMTGNHPSLLDRYYSTQVGHSFINNHAVPTASAGLFRGHSPKRLKVPHTQYDEYISSYIDRQLVPDKSAMVPSQQFLSYPQRRLQVGEPRSYVPPLSTLGMEERRNILGNRASEVAYTGVRSLLPLPISSSSIASYAASFRDLNQAACSNPAPFYRYGSSLHDRF